MARERSNGCACSNCQLNGEYASNGYLPMSESELREFLASIRAMPDTGPFLQIYNSMGRRK